MTLIKASLLTLFLILSSCASAHQPGPHTESYIVPVTFDTALTAAQREATLSAMGQWNRQTGGAVFFTEVPFPATTLAQERFLGVLIGVANSDHPNILIMDAMAKGTVLGVTFSGTRSPASNQTLILMVQDRLDNESWRGVMLHELGHSVGIGHLGDTEAVMYHLYKRNSSKCLLKSDLDAFCEKQVCKDFEIQPCEHAE